MNKKIFFSFFASLLFLSQAANAEIKIGKGSLTFNAGVASNYVFRGVEQNRAKPAPFAGADFTIPAGDFGLYLGTWFSASDSTDSHSYEYDVYAGVTKTIGIATFDIGYASYMYPDASTKAAEQTAEYYGKLTLAPDKKPYTFGVAYYVDDTDGIRDSSRKASQGTYSYYEANVTYDFGLAQSKVSYGIWENDTNTTTITLSKELATINFDLSLIKAEADNRNQSSLATTGDRAYVVLQAKKTF
jgi:uncharacterized protein (TIGR02001 family)